MQRFPKSYFLLWIIFFNFPNLAISAQESTLNIPLELKEWLSPIASSPYLGWEQKPEKTKRTGFTGGSFTDTYGTSDTIIRGLHINNDGSFYVVGRTYNPKDADILVAKFLPDGNRDLSFSTDGAISIDALAVDIAHSVTVGTDGKPVIVGRGHQFNYNWVILRLTSNGILDNTFNSVGYRYQDIDGGNDFARAVKIDSNNKIVVAGFADNGANYDVAVARFNSNGALDNTFNGGGIQQIDVAGNDDFGLSLSLEEGIKPVIGGSIQAANRSVLALRLMSNGVLDTTFSADGIFSGSLAGNDDAFSVALVNSTKFVVLGGQSAGTGFLVARLTSFGTLDTTFSADGYAITNVTANQPDQINKIYIDGQNRVVAGGFTHDGVDEDFALARYLTSGALDTTFDTDGVVISSLSATENDSISDMGESGAIIAVGVLESSRKKLAVARVSLDGTPSESGDEDHSFGTEGSAVLDNGGTGPAGNAKLHRDSLGRYVVTGFTAVDANPNNKKFSVARFLSDGSADSGFGTSGSNTFFIFGTNNQQYDSIIDNQNRIVVAGSGAGATEHVFARLNTAGQLDNTFSSDGKLNLAIGTSGYAKGITLQTNGKYVFCGTADPGLGTSFAATVGRLHTDGTLDTTFSSDGYALFNRVPDNDFGEVVITTDGKIIAVGEDGGNSKNWTAIWDGANWNAMGMSFGQPNTIVHNILYKGGQLFAGGSFTGIFAKWDGNEWTNTNNISGGGNVIALTGGTNGDVYVGGDFVNAGGIAAADRIARWDGSTFHALGSGIDNGEVRDILVVSNGEVYAGGTFTNASGIADGDFIAHWNGSTWNALTTGLSGTVHAMVTASNGEIYVGGDFVNVAGNPSFHRLARWDGSQFHPLTLAVAANIAVRALAIASNGDLYIGGDFTEIGTSMKAITRWDGVAFNTVGTGIPVGHINDILIASNGDLYIGGGFNDAGGVAAADNITRWDGSTWYALGNGFNGQVMKVQMATNGNIYVGGWFNDTGDLPEQTIITRFTDSGVVDNGFTFGTWWQNGYNSFSALTGAERFNSLAVETNGKIITVGRSDFDFLAVRFLSNGLFDTSFGTNGYAVADLGGTDIGNQVIPVPNGKYLIVGSKGNDGAIARLLSNGQLDVTFGTGGKRIYDFGGDESFDGVVLQSDGRIAIGMSQDSKLGILRIMP